MRCEIVQVLSRCFALYINRAFPEMGADHGRSERDTIAGLVRPFAGQSPRITVAGGAVV